MSRCYSFCSPLFERLRSDSGREHDFVCFPLLLSIILQLNNYIWQSFYRFLTKITNHFYIVNILYSCRIFLYCNCNSAPLDPPDTEFLAQPVMADSPTPMVVPAPALAAPATKMGFLGATSYVIGNIIGSGIFITPASILRSTESPGMALVIWVLCAGIALLGMEDYYCIIFSLDWQSTIVIFQVPFVTLN